MNFPSKFVKLAVNQLSSLPGIGKKTALRLVLNMLKRDKAVVENFGQTFINLIRNVGYCRNCYSISDIEICSVCNDSKRNKSIICVVEDIRVLMAIENTMQYKGVYHVLGGLISPMEGIGPSELKIDELVQKVQNNSISEVILALSTTMEGDTTNYYLFKRLKDYNVPISVIARGIAIGDELEYTDENTLASAISRRLPYEKSVIN